MFLLFNLQTNCAQYSYSIKVIHTHWFLSEKMARLKQSKDEAEKEVAAFRAQMELEFQRKVAEVKIELKYCLSPACREKTISLNPLEF